jgi:hypothetical protein
VAWLAGAGAAGAAEPVSVWYRSTEGCPGVEAFLARLETHAVTAAPARVGGRVDFVVTLGKDEQGSSGTLERQSAQGTIAIREVHAASCDAVADALVLTLALTVDPDATPTPGSAAEASGARTAASTAPAAELPANATEQPVATAPVSVSADQGPASNRAASTPSSPWRASVGAQGTVGSFMGTRALYGVNASVGLRYERGPRPSARAGFVAEWSSDARAELDVRLLLGRLEACPALLGRVVTFEGCAVLELGSLRAENTAPSGTADEGVWASVWALGRAGYALSPLWGLEFQAGLAVPLTHYDLSAGVPARVVAETNRIGFGLGAGTRLTFR